MRSQSVEQQILYVLFCNGHLINECDLDASDFTAASDAQIFEAMKAVAAENKPIDVVTVGEHLENQARHVDLQYMIELHEKGVGSAKSLKSYCDIVREASRKRKARNIAQNLAEQLEANIGDDPIAAAIRDLMAIDQVSQKHEYTMQEAVQAGLRLVEAAHKADGLVGITTGLAVLDSSIGGYHDSDLIVIPARPAMGKTAFLLSSANGCGVPAGIISAEQAAAQIGLRSISQRGGVNSQNLRNARLDESEWSRVSAASQSLFNMKTWINDKGSCSVEDVVRQARKWHFDNGIKILFVDYIQKLRPTNPRAPRHEQVGESVRTLKNLAKELNIPVVALAQVNRECEKREDKRPTMGDIADASEIEKEADVIMTLYRDEVYHEHTNDKGIAELGIVKNRHGPIGTVRCQFIGKYFQFKDFQQFASVEGAA